MNTHLKKGLKSIQSGDYLSAIDSLNEYINLVPQDESALKYLGYAYLASGQNEKSIEPLSQALEVDSLDIETIANLSIAYSNLGKRVEARSILSELRNLDEVGDKTAEATGWYYQTLAEYGKAIVEYEHISDIINFRVEDATNLACCYRKAGRINAARELLARILRDDPNNTLVLLEAGYLEYEESDFDKSRIFYNQAKDSDPENSLIDYYLAFTYFYQNQFEKALEHFQASFDKRSTISESSSLIGIGLAELKLGHRDKAIKVLETALEIDPNDINVLMYLYKIYLKSGMLIKAIRIHLLIIRTGRN